jgi:hypothetical protein
MKLEKLLCLKKRGSIVSENSFYFLTMKDSPSGDHETIESYFLSYTEIMVKNLLVIDVRVLHQQSHMF